MIKKKIMHNYLMNNSNIFLFTSLLLQLLNVIPNFGNVMMCQNWWQRKENTCFKTDVWREYTGENIILWFYVTNDK